MHLPNTHRLWISIAILSSSFIVRASAGTITYNFDTGTPALSAGNSAPITQTVNGLTATFNGAYSIQDNSTYNSPYVIPTFSGLYLNPNGVDRSILEIDFSAPITSLSFSFAGPAYGAFDNVGQTISIMAYQNLVVNGGQVASSSTTAPSATWSDTFQTGTANLDGAGATFNIVQIETSGSGPSAFLADNFVVNTQTTTPEPASLGLFIAGLAGLGFARRLRHNLR